MRVLTQNFLTYTVCGLWRPMHWTSNLAKWFYNAFTALAMFLVYTLAITQLLDLIFVVEGVDEFTTNSLMFITMISVCCKATSVILQRKEIIDLINILELEPCKPCNQEEIDIQTKFNNFIRLHSIRYAVLVVASCTSVSLRSLFAVTHGELPYRAWLPYRLSTVSFWITAMQQIIAVVFATIINVGTETIVFGFILQTCAQLEIMEYRLQKVVELNRTIEHYEKSLNKIPRKSNLADCISHHLKIFQYSRQVNSTFNIILFVQFFSSVLVLCCSVYHMSTSRATSVEFLTLVIYTIGMFVQIFIYCWSGNEVMFKSTNIKSAVYNTDWMLLSINDRKCLLIIMQRSTLPIRFTSSFLVTLTLDSYISILKASYSVFNLLQRT